MRRLLSSALLTLGLLTSAVGLLGAVLAGPDDTVGIVSEEVRGATGVPMVTHPDLTAFTGVDLVVSARAWGGVFLGAAHQVDLADLVGGVDHFEATRLLPSMVGGIDGVSSPGEKFLRSSRLEVTDLDVWRQQASGDDEDEQQIVVPLRDDPVGVLVHAESAVGEPVVGFAVRIDGLFVFSLLLAAAGAAVVALRWMHRRHARSRPPSGVEWSVENPLAGYEQPEISTGARPHAPARRATVALTVGALALSGCAAPAMLTTDTPQKVALRPEALPDLVTEHDARRAEAVKAARFPRSDTTRWTDAFEGPLLETARMTTSYEQVFKERSDPPASAKAGDRVWAPAFGSYPMWAFAEVDGLEAPVPVSAVRARKKREAKARKAGKKQAETTSLVLFTRRGAATQWRAFAAVQVLAGSLPAPSDGVHGPTPDDRTLEQAEAAAQRVESWWRTGKEEGITVDAESRRVRPNVATFRHGDRTRPTRLDFSEWSEPDERLRVVEVEDGHLMVTTFKLRVTLANPGGPVLSWRRPGSLVMGQNEHGPHTSTVVTGVVHLPTDGQPRLLGSRVLSLLG